MRGHLLGRARRRRLGVLRDVVDLEVLARGPAVVVAEIDRVGHRLVGDQGGQPVFVGDSGPAARGRGGVGDAVVRLRLADRLGVGGFLQRAVDHAQQTLEQHVVAGDVGLVFAADARPGKQLHRLAGGVLHALVDGEHVVVVDREHDLEGQPRTVVPGQRDRLGGGQLLVVVVHSVSTPGTFTLAARLGRPAILHVIGLGVGTRRQQPHKGRIRGQRFAVAEQHEVVEARAQQADRALHGGRVDLHARHFLGHRGGAGVGRADAARCCGVGGQAALVGRLASACASAPSASASADAGRRSAGSRAGSRSRWRSP